MASRSTASGTAAPSPVRIVARPVAKLTWASSMPSSRVSLRWIRVAQAAQVMPSMARSWRCVLVSALVSEPVSVATLPV